jgi:hypothetical protein
MVRSIARGSLAMQFAQLTAEEAQKVFDLATEDEKRAWAPMLTRKLRRARVPVP